MHRMVLACVALACLTLGCNGSTPPASAVTPAPAPAPSTPAPPPPPPKPPAKTATEFSGTYGKHRFFAMPEGGSVAATFTPFLPRNDQAVLGAASAVTSAVFKTTLRVENARIAGLEIAVPGSDRRTYYLFVIKEDTGEVHSMTIRRE